MYTAPAIATDEPSKKPTNEGAFTAVAGLTVLLNVKESWVIPSLTNSAHFNIWLVGIAVSQDFLDEVSFLSWDNKQSLISSFSLIL